MFDPARRQLTATRVLPVLALALAALDANAQSAGAAADERLELYETATVAARPLERATAAVSVIEREEIEALGVHSVAELVRFFGGLDLTSGGSRGSGATAQIRGGDPNFTLVLIDGIPINDPTDSVGGAVDLSALNLSQVERVEVLRGPLSSFYGSTGLAGAINVITRKARLDGLNWDAELAAGNADTYRGNAAIGARGERGDFRVGANWEQERGRIAADEFRSFGLEGNGEIVLGPRAKMRMVGRAATWEADDYPEFSGGPIYGTGAVRRSEHDEATVGMHLALGDPARPHRLRASYFRHERERTSPAVIEIGLPPTDGNSTFEEMHLGWSWPAWTAAGSTLVVGVGGEREDGRADERLFFGGPPLETSFSLARTTAGAWCEFVAGRGPWLVEFGARFDRPEKFDAEWSPRVGIAWKPAGSATRLRGAAGRSFKLPSFYALGDPLVGNPDLDPETALSADFGVDHEFADVNLSVSGGLFFNRFDDLINFNFAEFVLKNESRVETRGAELSLDWRPQASMALGFNLTRQDVDNVDSSEPIRQRPEWIAAARWRWNPTQAVGLSADLQTVTERFDQQGPVPERTTVAGYAVLGAAAVWRVGRQGVEIRARVDNLLDRDYQTQIGFPGPGRAVLLGLSRRSDGRRTGTSG